VDGDERVANVEDPDDYMEYSMVDGLEFGDMLKLALSQLRPSHQLSRNAQYVFNDFVVMVINRQCDLLVQKKLKFSPNNMKIVVSEMIPPTCDIREYAMKEVEKNKLQNEFLLNPLMAHINKSYPDLCDNDQANSEEWTAGVTTCAIVCDYLCSEMLEASAGLLTNNIYESKTVGVAHICYAILNDSGLLNLFEMVTCGLLYSNRESQLSIQIARMARQKESVRSLDDYYNHPYGDWITRAHELTGQSSELELIKFEIDYFRGKLPKNAKNIQVSRGCLPSISPAKFKDLVDICVVKMESQVKTTSDGIFVIQMALENYLSNLLHHAFSVLDIRVTDKGNDSDDDDDEDDEDNDSKKSVFLCMSVEDCQAAMALIPVKLYVNVSS